MNNENQEKCCCSDCFVDHFGDTCCNNSSVSCGCACDNTACKPEQGWTDNENSNGGNSTSCNNNSNCGNDSQDDTGWKDNYDSGSDTNCPSECPDNGNTGSTGNTPPTYPGSDECTGNCGGSCCGNTEEEIWGILILDDGNSDTDKTIKQGDELLYQVRFFPWGVKEKDIVWSSSNTNVVQIKLVSHIHNGARLIAHGEGIATITARTIDGEFSDSCTITVDSRERVEVKDEGEYFTVTFVEHSQEDGKVWKSVGCDIFEEYPNIRPWDAEDEDLPVLARNVKYNAYQTYTPEQLALLYRLDPLGVVRYVRDHLELNFPKNGNERDWEYLGRQLTFKDDVYCAIFDVNPRQFYFYPTDDGVLSYLNYKPAVRADYFSDAEFLFGKHSIPSFDWFDFITGCLDVFFTLTSPAYVAIKSVWGAVNTCHALFAASAVDGAISDASQGLIKLYMDETYGDVEEKAKKVLGIFFKPTKFIFGCIDSAVGAWDLIGTPDIEVYKSFNALEYCVVLKGKLRTLSLQEFISLCEKK